jgi:galactokinase
MTPFEKTVASLRDADIFFSRDEPLYVSRAPGRLDLMGGNVDYTGGLVFQSTIREATWAAVQRRKDRRIVFWNPQMNQEAWLDRVEFDLSSLRDDASVREFANVEPGTRWTAYVLGVFYLLGHRYPGQVITGANVYIESSVPLNKGVGSSAAVEVAAMKAVAAAYGINLCGVELAEACQWTENVIAESACGIMDQAASVLCDEDQMLPLVCQPCCPRPLVRLPPGLRCWGIDSGVRHVVTGIEYEAARAAAFVGYGLICGWESLPFVRDESSRIPRFVDRRWDGYISKVPPSLFRARYEDRLPLQLSGAEILAFGTLHPDPFTTIRPHVQYRVRACTRYAVEENRRVETFVDLAAGVNGSSEDRFRCMGELMFQSHSSYTECGLGCDATDLLVNLVRDDARLFGAKITGGGGGGTVAVLGAEGTDDALDRVVRRFAELRGFEPYVFKGSSMGADRFGVHVLE